MLTDMYGGSHPVYLFVLQPLNSGICNSYANPPPGAQTWNTLAGSDFSAQSSTNPMYNGSSQYSPPITVADSDGTVYHFTGIYQTRQGSTSYTSQLPDWVKDRNGNKTTISSQANGAFSVTDTLARTVLTSSGFGTNRNTITVSGLSSPYHVTWGSSSATTPINTPFAWINGPAGCAIQGSLTPTFSSV